MKHNKFSLIISLIILITLLAGCAVWQTAQEAAAETAVSPTNTPSPNLITTTGLTDPDLIVAPAALPLQTAGSTFTDPVFGTTMRRLTGIGSGSGGFATHIYSQLQAFSASNQYILLIENENYVVRRRDTLALMGSVDSSGWNAPRWHPTQATTLIHFDSNEDTTLRLQFTNVTNGQTSTVFTFPATYERIRSNQSFDEISRNGRYLAGMASLSNGDQMLFVLNLDTMTLGAEMALSADLYAGACAADPQWGELEPDWVGVSPLGNYLVVQWVRDGTTRCSGLETFNLTTGAFVGRVYDGHQHGDLGIMPDGTTEFFMTFELYHPSGNLSLGIRHLPGNAIVQDPTYIRTMDWVGDHISCQGLAGACLITTISDGSNGQQALEGELFLQYTNGSVQRLAHHRSGGCGYWVQPRASLSRDGRYAIFASDWAAETGQDSCGNGFDLGAGDAYLLDLEGGATSPPVTEIYLPTVSNNAVASTETPVPFGGSFTQRAIDTAVQHGQHVTISDLDKDGDDDIILSLSLDDAINLYRNDGSGQFTMSQIAPNDTIVTMETAVADMDNDGDLDVAAVGLFDRGSCGWGSGAFCEQPGAVVWYENPGNAAGSWSRHHVADLWGARTIATADLTGNGLPDLIVGSVTLFGQPDGVVWYRHHSSGDPWSGANSIDMTLGNVETVLTHDVDGDAVPDILAVDYDGNEIVWFENGRSANSPNNNPTLSKHIIGTLTNPTSIAVANMDGDGNPDLLATSNSGTIWYEAPANPTNTWSGTPIDATFGTGVSARVVAADFDGDGDTDVAVSSNDAAALRWYENDSGWTSHDISSYSGVTGFATGDLDGNGSPDLITTTYANNFGTDRLDWWQNQ